MVFAEDDDRIYLTLVFDSNSGLTVKSGEQRFTLNMKELYALYHFVGLLRENGSLDFSEGEMG
jgi:hypothetical protein